MEIMPSLLAKRNFDPLNTLLQLEPGYRDSPEPNDNMAIVFVKVHFWPSRLSKLALVKICACQGKASVCVCLQMTCMWQG